MVKLTDYAKSGGCAGKIGPAVLSNVLQQLPQQLHANLLVGLDTSDDAGVYKLSEDMLWSKRLIFQSHG